VVVPFPAGGPSDVVARVVTEQMGNVLGQSMVIENVSGAGGTISGGRRPLPATNCRRGIVESHEGAIGRGNSWKCCSIGVV
jgi:Tripartite tricarboxylate transporter family receptor